MTQIVDVNVPDVGDFTDIPIIEILVKPGDSVEKESPLVTLETDKNHGNSLAFQWFHQRNQSIRE